MNRRERAIAIRDCALALLREQGEWLRLADRTTRVLFVTIGRFSILCRTPFTALPRPSSTTYPAAVAAQRRVNLSYGLDLWCDGKKVLNVEWDDGELLDIVGFRGGAWEEEFLSSCGRVNGSS
jgi:hypothetical protein